MPLCFPEMGLEKIKFNRTNLEKTSNPAFLEEQKINRFLLSETVGT